MVARSWGVFLFLSLRLLVPSVALEAWGSCPSSFSILTFTNSQGCPPFGAARPDTALFSPAAAAEHPPFFDIRSRLPPSAAKWLLEQGPSFLNG